jgi:sugar phosphate isomerase/epimerase
MKRALTVLGGGVAVTALQAGESPTTTPGTGPSTGLAPLAPPAATAPTAPGFPISLNTSTLRGQKLSLERLVEIAAKAGYAGIEPWPDEIDRFVEAGGKLEDMAKRLADSGLRVTGAIAFFEWMVDDDARRAKGFEEAKRRMEQLARLGGTHVAAPPAGDVRAVELPRAAERYRALLEASRSIGVTPALEIWGPAAKLSKLSEVVYVALESGDPRACILPDVYHLYRGGSGLEGVRLLGGNIIAGFHLNDYPPSPPRESLRDSHRVYPGDGVAPLVRLCRDLRDIQYRGAVSVELFNPGYYAQDPEVVAKTAIEKTKLILKEALEGA